MILKCSKPILKWTVLLVITASLGGGVSYLFAATRGLMLETCIVLGTLFLLTALGLFRMLQWGRRLAVGLLWLTMLVLTIGRLSPGNVENYISKGEQIPSIEYLLATSILVLIPFLAALHILGKYRDQFRREWF